MSSILAGPKFNSRHHTFVPGAERLLQVMKSSGSVKKIFLGKIKTVRSGRCRIKICSIDGNLVKLKFRGVMAAQIFHVVAIDLVALRQLLEPFLE